MKEWNERAKEVAYLLNPAFCGRIIYNTVKEYEIASKRAFPVPLVYLILPLILHKKTRELISSRTQLLVWIQRYPHLLIDFHVRAKELVGITNEAMEFLFQTNFLMLNVNGEIETVKTQKALSKTKYIDDEVRECILKSGNVAKWFATAGKTETIYISLGVTP